MKNSIDILNGPLTRKIIRFALHIVLTSIVQQLFNSAGAAIFRSRGDSKRPLIALIISGAVNIMLNVLFVVVCGMNVVGVALAPVIATALSAGIVNLWLIREKRGADSRSGDSTAADSLT